ncbi:MAG: AMP-binding protein [Candidatus Acidiferrales bacterium]
MNFLDHIFEGLKAAGDATVVQEIHATRVESISGNSLLELIERARGFVRGAGLKKGERGALLGPNSIRWAAINLALTAEGIIVVPLYARGTPNDLAGMMKDCTPALLLCADAALRDSIAAVWSGAPPVTLFEDVFAPNGSSVSMPPALADDDPVVIIYTSGTSGEPKGVVLTVRNVSFMVPCTNTRLDQLMALHPNQSRPDQIFHFGPMSLAASWILLLTALSRNSTLALSMDLSRLGEEMKVAAPDYFLNVPILLERIRARIEGQIAQRGGFAAKLFARAKSAYARQRENAAGFGDSLSLKLAEWLIFTKIRKTIGPNLKALICGSAPLAVDTQLFFMMLGIPVLQVYGLTETTAICTLDDPRHPEPGFVGPSIPGIEMKLGEDSEILVRGPNIFPGYWNRPEATAQALRGGWFHTGDQGEVSPKGNWRIIGRVKNLIILNSGHKIPPEPLEEELRALVPAAEHVILIGNDRSFLSAVFSPTAANGLQSADLQAALDRLNAVLPHYRRIRAYRLAPEPFSIENGLLTANGKLRRDFILERLSPIIEEIYRKKNA